MSSRLERLLTGKKPRLIFIHVPKTGGSSIMYGLRRHYPFSWYNVRAAASLFAAKAINRKTGSDHVTDEQIQRVRIPLIHYAAGQDKRYIYGHVWYDETFEVLRSRGYLFVTCLREPVSRFFSHYLWNRYKSTSHDKTDLTFEQFLEAETTRPLGSLFVRYLGGIREDGDYTSQQAIDKAIGNLSSLDIVGHLENLDGFRTQIRQKLDIKLKLGHEKPSPAPTEEAKKIKESQQFRKAVEELCRPDLEFYHRIRKVQI